MTRAVLCCLVLLASTSNGVVRATADGAPEPVALERTDAFENAYAASFYQFDACGDGIAGRIYRSALVEKVKQCPFSEAARRRFQLRVTAQRRKSSQVMAKLIDANGGLPMRLDGMTKTCREQSETPEYRSVRSRLEDFASGKVGSDAVVAQPCDAAAIAP